MNNRYALKTKEFCEKEYRDCERCLENSMFSVFEGIFTKAEMVEKSIDRSFGALQFVLNNLGEPYDEDLAKWWENDMLQRFRELKKSVM